VHQWRIHTFFLFFAIVGLSLASCFLAIAGTAQKNQTSKSITRLYRLKFIKCVIGAVLAEGLLYVTIAEKFLSGGPPAWCFLGEASPMVILSKIYTRSGDDGTTALGTGERRVKNDLRIEAYGTVDEANSAIGLARLSTAQTPDHALVDAMLLRIQNDMFDLGADLATPETAEKPPYEPLRIIASQVDRLEKEIDELNAELSPLQTFVLPGGCPAAAALHLARTIARRAERLIVALAAKPAEIVSPPALQYINRLSDFLFVAARYVNKKGATDLLWVPGANR
jgi:cob(I)alamin adenosyltransferase